MREFWEEAFWCTFSDAPPLDEGRVLCTGQEDLAQTYFLMSDIRYEYNVYNAVYDLAHALHDLLRCEPGRGPFTGHSCASLQSIQPWQVRYEFRLLTQTLPMKHTLLCKYCRGIISYTHFLACALPGNGQLHQIIWGACII